MPPGYYDATIKIFGGLTVNVLVYYDGTEIDQINIVGINNKLTKHVNWIWNKLDKNQKELDNFYEAIYDSLFYQ